MARLMLSVAPEVKMISSGSAPISEAISSLAFFTASEAFHPYACWRLDAFPKSLVNHGIIASTTRGSQGVVA